MSYVDHNTNYYTNLEKGHVIRQIKAILESLKEGSVLIKMTFSLKIELKDPSLDQ